MTTAITRAVNALKTKYRLSDEEIVADEGKRLIQLNFRGLSRVFEVQPYTSFERIVARVRPVITARIKESARIEAEKHQKTLF